MGILECDCDLPNGRLVVHHNESGFITSIDWYETGNPNEEPLRYYPAVVSNRIEALIHLVDDQQILSIGEPCDTNLDCEELPQQ